MPYNWENEKIIVMSVNANVRKDTILPAKWLQKMICRACNGNGCPTCSSFGYFTKSQSQSVQVKDNIQNGTWLRFIGMGDERPDYSGFGDVVVLLHVLGMEVPSSVQPGLGSNNTDHNVFFPGFEDIFGNSNLPEPVYFKLRITKQEAKEGCGKEITVNTFCPCKICKGIGVKPENPSVFCEGCKGSGCNTNSTNLLIQIPPKTKNNVRIKIEGKGNTAIINGNLRTGDVYAHIKVKWWAL